MNCGDEDNVILFHSKTQHDCGKLLSLRLTNVLKVLKFAL